MTISEKIIAIHAGKDSVKPGDIVEVAPDVLMANDVTAPPAIEEMAKMGADKVFDPDRVVFVMDHFTPNKDIRSATMCQKAREFAKKQGIRRFFDGGYGIEHVVLPELGIVRPGDLIVGADSHTTTYGGLGAFSTGVGQTDLAGAMALGKIWLKVPETIRCVFNGNLPKWVGGKDLVLAVIGRIGVDGALYCALEFAGEAMRQLDMDGRFTMCNMAIEAGGKAGIVEPDESTEEYVKEAQSEYARPMKWGPVRGDPGAPAFKILEFQVGDMEPQVAAPHIPSNVVPVSRLKDVKIDQVVIGSCTNGRLNDLRVAAEVLKGKKVDRWVRALAVPGSQRVFLQALKEGIIQTLAEAGVAISAPTCGPCFGGHTGAITAGERCVSTTNRNFVGRMGHEKSELYLANPAVAAASAILGRIAHPGEVS
ncbi:MAG: 3-isopropylmalate dehydratase large subunit [Firmicutes bacterium]|nr:3-isopropylmalate dehydratase large subunit [Bacillota bacterium]